MDDPTPASTTDVRLRVRNGRHPLLLGLAGDSASGKSTLSRGIEYVLGKERVGRVCTDDYHRFDRAERERLGVTPLHPEANFMDRMAADLRALASGRSVSKPTYDHLTGTFGPDETVEPGEVVVVEGLLPLADRDTRDAIDVAVFLEPEEMLRRRWKLERDVFDRGYSAQQVVDEIRRREADAEAYVRPQRVFADVVVAFHRRPDASFDEPLSARLTVRPTLPFSGLRELVGSLRSDDLAPIRWSSGHDGGGPLSVLDIDGNCPPDIGAEIEEVLWSSLHPDVGLARDRIGIVRTPGLDESRSEALALVQLLIVSHLTGPHDGALEL
ncbi:MAG: phosphoribulokinase [Actinomycetota bacterium]|nr:phosphoribulokinase [Actinomycetota bacterium]MDH5314041.1 phosphoribulokinase [Actinomycetota bacterium]